MILSDIQWNNCPDGPSEAVDFLDPNVPSGTGGVFYIANREVKKKRIPVYAHQLTNSFEEMLHSVLDVINRSDRLAE